jgi:hypothetical protein
MTQTRASGCSRYSPGLTHLPQTDSVRCGHPDLPLSAHRTLLPLSAQSGRVEDVPASVVGPMRLVHPNRSSQARPSVPHFLP